MLVSKTMPNTTAETPDWLREMETILEELHEGVVVVDDQLRVIIANEAVTRLGHFDHEEIPGRTTKRGQRHCGAQFICFWAIPRLSATV